MRVSLGRPPRAVGYASPEPLPERPFKRRRSPRPQSGAHPRPPTPRQRVHTRSMGPAQRARQTPVLPRSHLPVEGEQGYWLGARGESGWVSHHPAVQRTTGGAPVQFSNHYPDFSPWAQATVTLPWMALTGEASDMPLADAALAQERACQRQDIAWMRKTERLLWHHCEDGRTMLLLPIDLHMHVPHTGGASMLRHLRDMHAS